MAAGADRASAPMAPITAMDLRTAKLLEWFASLIVFEKKVGMQGLERERPPLLAMRLRRGPSPSFSSAIADGTEKRYYAWRPTKRRN
jgi:hypothetical protein